MTLQKYVFLAGEGEAWLRRNQHKLGSADPVTDMLNAHSIKPTSVLEVGCSDGWRLRRFQEQFMDTRAVGVDPAGPRFEEPVIHRGTADDLSMFPDGQFDLVIYGFCLYLADPPDYFVIAAEGDRVLKDGGYMAIHDFWSDLPFKRQYKHVDNVWSYHFDPEMLWLCHPAYVSIDEKHFGEEAVHLIHKDYSNAFYEAA